MSRSSAGVTLGVVSAQRPLPTLGRLRLRTDEGFRPEGGEHPSGARVWNVAYRSGGTD